MGSSYSGQSVGPHHKGFRCALALAILGTQFFAGCGQQPVPEGPEGSPVKVIGFSVFDLQPNFFQEMEKGTRDACEELGYAYRLHDQKYDPALMIAGCENLLAQGIDALIVSPCEPSALGPVVKRAKDQGIPVVINDIGGGNSDYDAIVISDCPGGGKMAAEYMAAALEKGPEAAREVGIIKCAPGHVYAIRRGEGFKARMEEKGYRVFELCANDVRDQGYRVTQDMLTAHPNIAGIFSENDPMALGAIQAIRDAGKSAVDDILVIGFNADPEAIEAIRAGYMAATIRQSPYDMGRKCVILVDRLLKGGTVEYTDEALREITVPVHLVTKEEV